jgi:hypothetical protein
LCIELEYTLVFYLKIASALKNNLKKMERTLQKMYLWFELEYNLAFYLKIASALKNNL